MFYGEAIQSLLAAQQHCLRIGESYNPRIDDNVKRENRSAAMVLSKATPFWWNKDTTAAVLNASEIYPDITPLSRDLLYTDIGWCHFTQPLFVFKVDSDFFIVRGLLWAYHYVVRGERTKGPFVGPLIPLPNGEQAELGLTVMGFCETRGLPPAPLIAGLLFEGENLSERHRRIENPLEAEEKILRFVLAAGAWLRQRILIAREEHPNHQTRKMIKQIQSNMVIPNICVVQLRRPESSSHDSKSLGQVIDWQCQWMVRGHWRNQYYAKSGDHMPKYIHPYIKGPEDKPLKPPSGEIFAVTR